MAALFAKLAETISKLNILKWPFKMLHLFLANIKHSHRISTL